MSGSQPTGEPVVVPRVDRPKRGQWVTLTLESGHTVTGRYDGAFNARGEKAVRWCIDHGAYGAHRDDCYHLERTIRKWEPTTRPQWRASFVDPYGVRRTIGRYATRAEAEAAIALRSYARNVLIEERAAEARKTRQ